MMEIDCRSFVLSVLLLKEGDGWVAQCLNFDIAAQGRTLREAQASFSRVFIARVVLDAQRGREPLQGIMPAPPWYWERFQEGIALRDSVLLMPPSVAASGLPEVSAQATDIRIFEQQAA